MLTDAKGGTAVVTTANVMQSNGLIHVIDGVLQPRGFPILSNLTGYDGTIRKPKRV